MDNPGPWTELETSPWGQCLNRACERIIALELENIEGNVWIRDPLVIKETALPAVVVGVNPSSHNPSDGTMTAPDRLLRAVVGIVYAADGVPQASLPARLLAEHKIFKAFSKQSGPFNLTGTGADNCQLLKTTVEPGTPSDEAAARDLKLAAGYLVIGFHVRYPSTTA
jgi:hypothetical protein